MFQTSRTFYYNVLKKLTFIFMKLLLAVLKKLWRLCINGAMRVENWLKVTKGGNREINQKAIVIIQVNRCLLSLVEAMERMKMIQIGRKRLGYRCIKSQRGHILLTTESLNTVLYKWRMDNINYIKSISRFID